MEKSIISVPRCLSSIIPVNQNSYPLFRLPKNMLTPHTPFKMQVSMYFYDDSIMSIYLTLLVCMHLRTATAT